MEFITDVGLEIHVQLDTRSKIFCSCSTAFGGEPNTRCCGVCTGQPGALPVLNKAVVEYAVRAGVNFGCETAPRLLFQRKHYYYPDQPRAYQITQFTAPLCRGGGLWFEFEGEERFAQFAEMHIEDDAGKLIHYPDGRVGVDYNRCGVPLLEIVTRPCFHSGAETAAFLEELILTLRCLGISDCRMQEGSLRADVNLSVRMPGKGEGQRTEMKNLGSVRAVRLAVDYESGRHGAIIAAGGSVKRETRRWNEDKNISEPMRAKESSRDYRYVPEPDLPPVGTEETVRKILAEKRPDLPLQRRKRYAAEYGLSENFCRVLSQDNGVAEFFEKCIALGAEAKQSAGWICGEGMKVLKSRGGRLSDSMMTPEKLAAIIALTSSGALSRDSARRVFEEMFDRQEEPEEYARRLGLLAEVTRQEVEAAVKAVLERCASQVEEYRNGKTKIFAYFKGQVMRQLAGKGNPAIIDEVLSKFL